MGGGRGAPPQPCALEKVFSQTPLMPYRVILHPNHRQSFVVCNTKLYEL